MRADRDNPTIKALYKVKPHALRVHVRGEETPRMLPLGEGRNRWQRIAGLLDAIAWEWLEALDKAGGVLAIVRADEMDDDEGAQPDRIDDVRDLTGIMRDIVRDTMREARMMFEGASSAQTAVIQGLVDAMGVQRSAFEMALKLQAAHLAAPDAPEGGGMERMMQVAAMLSSMPRPAPKPATAAPASNHNGKKVA